ncbi:hypothetical protein [Yoonia sp.]
MSPKPTTPVAFAQFWKLPDLGIDVFDMLFIDFRYFPAAPLEDA